MTPSFGQGGATFFSGPLLFRVKSTLNLVTSSVLGQSALSHARMTLAGCCLLYNGSPSASLRLAIAVITSASMPPASPQPSKRSARPSHEPTDMVTRPSAPFFRTRMPQVGTFEVGAAQFGSLSFNGSP